MIKNENNYEAENLCEEALMMMGRVNAFIAYVNSCKYSIERDICASMLGFEITETNNTDDIQM